MEAKRIASHRLGSAKTKETIIIGRSLPRSFAGWVPRSSTPLALTFMEGVPDRQRPEGKKLVLYILAFFILLYLLAVYQGCSAIKSLPTDKPNNFPSQQAALGSSASLSLQ